MSTAQLLPLSARHPDALRRLALAYADFLDAHPDVPLRDVCFTASAGRMHFARRLAVAGVDAAGVAGLLRARSLTVTAEAVESQPPVAWMFTGQGSQRPGMGAQLYQREPVFRAALDRCDAIFRETGGGSLRDVMNGNGKGDLNQTAWTQPALFALEYALAELWRHWSVLPAAVIGHSIGEYVAATVAGVFSVEDGLRLVAARGRLIQALPAQGGMLAVFGGYDAARLASARFDGVGVAAINGRQEIVLSGPRILLDRIAVTLGAQGIDTRALSVSHAFHSTLLRPIVEPFAEALASVRFSEPRVDVISNVTGEKAGSEISTPEYWLRHLLEPVRFSDGLHTLAAMGISRYLELGPHPVLSALGEKASGSSEMVWLASMRRGADEHMQILAALGGLYEAGVTPDWSALHEHRSVRRVALPTYAFQRERCWIDPPATVSYTATRNDGAAEADRHPVLGRRLPGVAALPQTTLWEIDDVAARAEWGAYRLGRSPLLPPSAFIEIVGAAAREALSAPGVVIDRLSLVDAEQVIVEPGLSLQVAAKQFGRQHVEISLHRRAPQATEWTEIATARATKMHSSDRVEQAAVLQQTVALGVMFFNGADTVAGEGDDEDDRYRLVLETARFADRQGFSSIWVPERHYTRFGGLYPNPAVLHAALARETSEIRLMAGSVVLPLHHPLSAAEDWALVDNLSRGRVGVSVASGWNPEDFAVHPERYDDRHARVFDQIPLLQRLWRGEPIDATSGSGQPIRVRTYPAPVQPELPLWVTAAGNPRTFTRAGEIGANLLTHLLDQDAEELAGKIAVYREARQRHGHDPSTGRVTVMLHTFLGDDVETVRELVREPYCQYIKENIGLLKGLAYSRGTDIDLGKLSAHDLDEFVSFIYDRFFSTRALLGTPESCLPLVRRLTAAGVNEIACLVDFGPPTSQVVRHLPHLAALRDRISRDADDSGQVPARAIAGVQFGAARTEDLAAIQSRCGEEFAAAAFYRRLQSRGVEFGTALQGARHFWRCDGEALVRIEPSPVSVARTIELALQAFAAALPSAAFTSASEAIFVAASLRRVEILRPDAIVAWSHATIEDDARRTDSFAGAIDLLDETGRVVACIKRFAVRHATTKATVSPATDAGLYEVIWEAKSLERAPRPPKGVWVLLADRGGVARAIGDRLEAAGHATVAIDSSDVDPLDVEAIRRVFAVAVQGHETVAGIVHAWSLDAPANEALTDQSLAAQEAIGCGALLHVVQAVAGGAATPRIWIVTRNAQWTDDEPAPNAVAQALVWGFGRAIAVEHPELWGGLVDLPPEQSVDEAAWVVDEIIASDGEDQVAYRRGQRRVARLVASAKPPEATARFDAEASYLITGGVGGLGRHLARWMIESGATDLVLTGLHERARGDLDRELSRSGVRIEIVAADVSDRAAMEAVVASIAARGKLLKGVVHLAGVPEDTPLADARFEDGIRVLAPKVAGAWILHQLTHHLPIDCFIAFSSISAVWGSRGQPFYGAANHFLDALTIFRRRHGLPMVTVNWGPWAEGGMVDHDGLVRLERMGLRALPPATALDRLARLHGSTAGLRVVADVNWPLFKELFESRGPRPLLARVGVAATIADARAETPLAREVRALDSGPRRDRLAEFVHLEVAAVLGWTNPRPPDRRSGFFDLGMDSLMALDLKNRLQAAFGLPLRATVVFNYSTVDALAEFLTRQLMPLSAAEQLAPASTMEQAVSAPAEVDSPADTLSEEELVRLFDEQIEAIDRDAVPRSDNG